MRRKAALHGWDFQCSSVPTPQARLRSRSLSRTWDMPRARSSRSLRTSQALARSPPSPPALRTQRRLAGSELEPATKPAAEGFDIPEALSPAFRTRPTSPARAPTAEEPEHSARQSPTGASEAFHFGDAVRQLWAILLDELSGKDAVNSDMHHRQHTECKQEEEKHQQGRQSYE